MNKQQQQTEINNQINLFTKDQSLKCIQALKNLGVVLKILKSGTWQELNEYELPFENFIPLYNDEFIIDAIGIY